MPEHPIRLRGAWLWSLGADPDAKPHRVTLPTLWPGDLGGPIRLVRQFGGPPIDPGIEQVRIELGDVPGLVSARLNGSEIVRAGGELADFSVEVAGPLLARNELVLEVDFRRMARSIRDVPWGTISLVIAPKPARDG